MKKRTTYRSIDFNDERKWKSTQPLDDVLQVGIHKSIGYVFSSPDNEPDLEGLKDQFLKQKKLVDVRPRYDGEYTILHVGDREMMQAIIDQNKDVLIKSKWSLEAEKVFKKICSTDIDHDKNKELYHLIADLFNSWCLWCEDQTLVEKVINGKKHCTFLSVNPYDPDLEKVDSIK